MFLKCFFESYDEYTLHSKLSPQQLKEMLDKDCVRSFFTQDAWQQRMNLNNNQALYVLEQNKEEYILTPVMTTRNSARPRLHLTVEAEKNGSKIKVEARPINLTILILFWALLLLGVVIWGICVDNPKVLLSLIMYPAGYFMFYLSRKRAALEYPSIRQTFDAFIKKLEEPVEPEKQ